jgi:ribosome-binding protein aMBF1 (putative translation factor)
MYICKNQQLLFLQISCSDASHLSLRIYVVVIEQIAKQLRRHFFVDLTVVMKRSKIIADLRNAKGWSQADLANETGISQGMVGKYERGDAILSIEVAKRITDALEVSLDFLIGE